MTKDEFINTKIEEYRNAIIDAVRYQELSNLDRLLRMFSKEIERETRHAAAQMAQRLSNDIHNL